MAITSKSKVKAKPKLKTKAKALVKATAKAKPKAALKAKPTLKAKAKVVAKPKVATKKIKPKAAPKKASIKPAVKKAKLVPKKAVAKAKALPKKVAAKLKPAPKKAVSKPKPVAKAKSVTKVKPAAKAKVKPVLKAVPKVVAKIVPKAPSRVLIQPKKKVELKAPVKLPMREAVIPKAPSKPKVKIEVEKMSSERATAGTGGPIDFVPYNAVRDEEYMNAQQAEHFRKILKDWLTELREEVDVTMAHMQEEMGTYPDPVDRAAQEEEFSLELRARDRERRLIKKIEQAIDAIDHNDYGYCNDCGAEIGIRRLEARPTADKCIDCKTFEEIKEKQVGA